MEIHLKVSSAVLGEGSKKRERDKKKKKKKDKKKEDKKQRKKNRREQVTPQDGLGGSTYLSSASDSATSAPDGGVSIRSLVESSALDYAREESRASAKQESDHPLLSEKKSPLETHDRNTTLLLFYQYVEPAWSVSKYTTAKHELAGIAQNSGVTGRMRVAREGLNCTLTGTAQAIMRFCTQLRHWDPVFLNTEFKLTHDLPDKQLFRELKVIPVLELVHYGLEGEKAPPILHFGGTHLEPKDYHAKLAEEETVVIDVRNHYEAVIGRFDAPNSKWLDPKMRKSTSFPVWLDDPSTKKELANKQVLMKLLLAVDGDCSDLTPFFHMSEPPNSKYCTGGIRCERASALLKYKMETDPEVAALNIKGVYQLQGGIDKYFKEFPDGGYWKGKNYVFDKRFAHAPPAAGASTMRTEDSVTVESRKEGEGSDAFQQSKKSTEILGKCECCGKPWDMFRGKRRCPTCGVPSLICRDCSEQEGSRNLKDVRCDLCVEQNIRSKRDFQAKEQREIREYESRLMVRGLLRPSKADAGVAPAPPNPGRVTRLYLKNMCKKEMTEDVLMNHIPGITHIVWKIDHRSQTFLGAGWVEMETPEAAALAVAKSGQVVLRRPVYIEYQPAGGKDQWPPPYSAVTRRLNS